MRDLLSSFFAPCLSPGQEKQLRSTPELSGHEATQDGPRKDHENKDL
jgi:hypothetical protein